MLVQENVFKIKLIAIKKNTIRHFIQTDIITFKPFSSLKMVGNGNLIGAEGSYALKIKSLFQVRFCTEHRHHVSGHPMEKTIN